MLRFVEEYKNVRVYISTGEKEYGSDDSKTTTGEGSTKTGRWVEVLITEDAGGTSAESATHYLKEYLDGNPSKVSKQVRLWGCTFQLSCLIYWKRRIGVSPGFFLKFSLANAQ